MAPSPGTTEEGAGGKSPILLAKLPGPGAQEYTIPTLEGEKKKKKGKEILGNCIIIQHKRDTQVVY